MATVIERKLFQYPQEIKGDFLKTKGLNFSDGTHVTAAEIWRFMTEEAPKRFPYAFDLGTHNISRISQDVTFFSGIKRSYLSLTIKDRLQKARAEGRPVILCQGGQTMDIYYAGGGIPLRPAYTSQWARNQQEGLSIRQNDLRGVNILESGRNRISMESCNQIASHAAIDNRIVSVDMVAPYLCLRCSDMVYLTESHRSQPESKTDLFLVDYPVESADKPWAVDLVASELRQLVKKISAFSGRPANDEEIFRLIKLGNRARALVREISDLWWNAPVPPTNSTDASVAGIANDLLGDPIATVELLEQIRDEVKWRVENQIKGFGIADKPKRLLVCGSCVGPNSYQVERAGGIVVGRDDGYNLVTVDVEESGDPYRNIAKSILSFPYEYPTDKRAAWTIGLVKKSRADGVIFMYHWGCNFQTGVARMVSDIVKQGSGVPTTFIEMGELGRAEDTEQSVNRVESFLEML
jgi:benzoyl-CoA reductase/2-hydroxyglutaryl-CoA dehydratase subunit BcrC/BadD/HgdB